VRVAFAPGVVAPRHNHPGEEIDAKTTTLPTSHVPMLSRPNDVATVILAAVTAVKQKDV
jgi:hypothetical protein